MLELIQNWAGNVTVDGTTYENVTDIPSIESQKPVTFIFSPDMNTTITESKLVEPLDSPKLVEHMEIGKSYQVKVRQYMTKPATIDFDFMDKFNNGIPMPMRVMVGTVIRETAGMYLMELHGDIIHKITPTCMKCGRPIPNKISQYFGMGPECGQHGYINPFDSDEELERHVEEYRQELKNITWTGYVIKKAIEEIEEI